MRKESVLYCFFQINPVEVLAFKQKLRNYVVPRITTTTQMLKNETQPITALNVAFSQSGINKLVQNTTIVGDVGDPVFAAGQAADAPNLGDDKTTWEPAFKSGNIDGVFIIASV